MENLRLTPWNEKQMIAKYLATLAIAVCLVSWGASSLQFATRSQVLSGTTVEETLRLEFTIDADGSHTYEINPGIAQFLRDHISFYTEGPARVVSAGVEITPQDVTWTEDRTTITSKGAAMAAKVRWNTPAASPNGAHSSIYFSFPEIPRLQGKAPAFHSGGYQKDKLGRYIVRELTTYQEPFRLSLARFVFALSAGLPFGILLHTIFWAFVLKGEKRSRLAQLAVQGSGLPRTFYSSPIAEWVVWLIVLGIGAFVPGMLAGFSVGDGFMSSAMIWFAYSFLAAGAALAVAAARFSRKSLLTVRVDRNGICYARGRGDLQWLSAAWSDIRLFTQKSRTTRGNTSYWMELEFQDNRKKLKIGQTMVDYPALRDLLTGALPSSR